MELIHVQARRSQNACVIYCIFYTVSVGGGGGITDLPLCNCNL